MLMVVLLMVLTLLVWLEPVLNVSYFIYELFILSFLGIYRCDLESSLLSLLMLEKVLLSDLMYLLFLLCMESPSLEL